MTDYRGLATTRIYDRRNRLERLTTPEGVTTYTHNGANQWLTVTYPGGVKQEASYDTASRLTGVVNHKSDGTVLSSFTYGLDDMGQKISVTDDVGTTQYRYDANNRLDLVTEPSGRTTEYTYDGAGNRLTQTVTPPGGPAEVTSYRYDGANRLELVTTPDATTVSYTFDARGHLAGDGTNSYEYDGLNRLIAVKQGGATVATYGYNGDGLRTQKAVGADITRYYYDRDRVLNEGDGATVTTSNTWGLGLIRREKADEEAGYYLFNGHGDVVGVADTTGSMLATYRYDAFGGPESFTGTFDNPFRYTAEPWDAETGSIYLRARYYNPSLGRFTTQDTEEPPDFCREVLMACPYVCLVQSGWWPPPQREVVTLMKFTVEVTLEELLAALLFTAAAIKFFSN